MTELANNLRIAISSTITQNQSFDLTALFVNRTLLDGIYFARNDAATNTDPFLLTLPSFSNQTLSLTIEDDLNGFAGQSFSIEVQELETSGSGPDTVLNTYQIEIDVVDASTNTLDDITVRKNQLEHVFDPADVDFGLANPISINSYTITDGKAYWEIHILMKWSRSMIMLCLILFDLA